MLPASTYPAEIADADAWFKRGGTVSGIEGQGWDESVRAIAYYPDILKMMAGDFGLDCRTSELHFSTSRRT